MTTLPRHLSRINPANDITLFVILKRILLIGLFVFTTGILEAQRYPATTSLQLIPPFPADLEKYTLPESDRLLATVVFNDFSQTSWNIKLRLTIGNTSLRLQTNPDAIMNVITLTPGIPEQLTGFDLTEYLNYNNMLLSGITREDILRRGGLPDGHYTFTLEALDARTNIPISNKSTATVWLILNDPPQITYPVCGERLAFSDPQNITFQWLPMHTASPNSNINTEYEFTLAEIPEGLNANEAILSGMPILSTTINANTFLYGAEFPALENGKNFAFRIRATDVDNLSLFKNDGYSQVCWFTYGYGINGSISPTRPANESLININSTPVFAWNGPDNATSSQPVTYALKIVELPTGTDAANVLSLNNFVFQHTTPESAGANGFALRLDDKVLDPQKEYAWQVHAYTEGVEIAASPVMRFSTTPVIREFLAGQHTIRIVSITSQDLENFSGKGRVKVSPDGTEAEFDFSGIKISAAAGKLMMNGGTIEFDVPEILQNITLNPADNVNGNAYFRARRMKITKEEMNLSGFTEWALPFAITSGEQAWVRSETVQINYDNLMLNGYCKLDASNAFLLLDPFGIDLKLTPETSNFFLKDNQYTQNFNCELTLPETIRSEDGSRVKISMNAIQQLFYIEVGATEKAIDLVKNLSIDLQPKKITVDFSEQRSPQRFSGNASWKGISFDEYEVVYHSKIDPNQLILDEPLRDAYVLNGSTDATAWVDNEGLQFVLEKNFQPAANDFSTFNKFRCRLTHHKLVIRSGVVTEGSFHGEIRVPLLDGKYFSFTIPVSADGFEEGYLEEGFVGKTYAFNSQNPSQALQLSITQAIFADYERLDVVLDVEWPGIDVHMSDVEGFRIYGNGLVGFGAPNGKRDLAVFETGAIDNFPITVKAIGAGYHNKKYFFNTTAEIILAPDLAGENGPPQVNFYSMSEALLTDNESEVIAVAAKKEVSKDNTYVNIPHGRDQRFDETGNLLTDSVFVAVDIFMVRLHGYLKLAFNDPEWGTSFQGALDGTMRLPVNANIHATMLAGRMDDEPYFFVEGGMVVGGADRNEDKNLNIANRAGSNRNAARNYKLTKSRLFQKVEEFQSGIPLGPLSVVGGDFRFYYHMSHTEPDDVTAGGTGHEIAFEPDPNNDYGVYGRIALRDLASNGELFNIDAAFEASRTSGSMTYGFEGTIEVGNNRRGAEPGKSAVETNVARDSKSAFTGTGKFVFNKDEGHYLGDFWMVVATPTLCAEGGLAFDLKPGYWKISLGKPDQRILFIPGCDGWSPTGYLAFDPNEFELGLGFGLAMGVESGWFGPSGFKLNAKADFGFTAGIVAAVQVRPSFAIKKASLWAEAWAAIALDYETWFESGTWVIASASLSGDLTMYFDEQTRLEGTLEGEANVIGLAVGFEMNVNHNL